MGIDASKAPAAAFEAVNRAVAARAAASPFASSGLCKAKLDALSIAMPHRVAYLPLDSIRSARSLREVAKLGNWRFLVHEKRSARKSANDRAGETPEHSPVAVATVAADSGGQYRLSQLSGGSSAERIEKAIEFARNLPAVVNGRFEVLLLAASALQVTALWLRNCDDGGEDADIILIVSSRFPKASLKPHQQLSPAEFLRILRVLAEKVPSDDQIVDSV